MRELKKGNCEQGIGKLRGGLTTKIHAVTDGYVYAIDFIITGGNVHDCTQAENLVSSTIHKGVSVLADRAYDTDKIIKYINIKARYYSNI